MVVERCFRNGLLLLGCGKSGVRFCPPLVVSETEIDLCVDIFGSTCDNCFKFVIESREA
jgi:4-aminobutyrate aminotransferase